MLSARSWRRSVSFDGRGSLKRGWCKVFAMLTGCSGGPRSSRRKYKYSNETGSDGLPIDGVYNGTTYNTRRRRPRLAVALIANRGKIMSCISIPHWGPVKLGMKSANDRLTMSPRAYRGKEEGISVLCWTPRKSAELHGWRARDQCTVNFYTGLPANTYEHI